MGKQEEEWGIEEKPPLTGGPGRAGNCSADLQPIVRDSGMRMEGSGVWGGVDRRAWVGTPRSPLPPPTK